MGLAMFQSRLRRGVAPKPPPDMARHPGSERAAQRNRRQYEALLPAVRAWRTYQGAGPSKTFDGLRRGLIKAVLRMPMALAGPSLIILRLQALYPWDGLGATVAAAPPFAH